MVLLFSAVAGGQEFDPTRPIVGSAGAIKNQSVKKTLVLQSIVNHGHGKTVIINDKILKLGERIAQYRLTKINAKSVVLSSQEKRITLSLFSEIMAKSQ